MKTKRVQHHIDGLIALTMFSVFAVCILITLLAGAQAYSRLAQRDRLAYGRRTCVQYVATKVHNADSSGAISVEELGGADVLVLGAGSEYVTRIYCYDGYLRELYCSAEHPMSPEEGERIIEAESMELSLNGNLLAVTVTANAEANTLLLSLRGGEEKAVL